MNKYEYAYIMKNKLETTLWLGAPPMKTCLNLAWSDEHNGFGYEMLGFARRVTDWLPVDVPPEYIRCSGGEHWLATEDGFSFNGYHQLLRKQDCMAWASIMPQLALAACAELRDIIAAHGLYRRSHFVAPGCLTLDNGVVLQKGERLDEEKAALAAVEAFYKKLQDKGDSLFSNEKGDEEELAAEAKALF